MKKMISVFLVLIIVIGNASFAYGASDNTLSVSSASGKPGSTVSVAVSFSGSAQYSGGAFCVIYDASKLDLKDVEKNSVLKGATVNINKAFKSNTIRMNWITSAELGAGNLCVISFKIKANASGAADITFSEVAFSDINGEPIHPVIENGTVNINDTQESTSSPVGTGGTISVSTPAPTSSSTTPKPVPKDVGEVAWAQSYIQDVIDRGIMKGYVEADGSTSFRPGGTATRAEFATALCNYLGFEQTEGVAFADMQEHWAAGYVAKMTKEGIMAGYGAEEFAPDDAITREQIAVILYRAFELKAGTVDFHYADEGNISNWAAQGVYSAREAGWMTGDDTGFFRPQDTATRAEIATIFSRLAGTGVKRP